MHCHICGLSRFKIIYSFNKYILVRCLNCKIVRTQSIAGDIKKYKDIYSSSEQARKHLSSQYKEFTLFARNILDQVEHKNGKLLDVGCGFGWVVAEAEKRGFDAIGIDPSKIYTDLGRKTLKVKLIVRSLENYRTNRKFDVIIINHVLEHIEDPIKFLVKTKTLLKNIRLTATYFLLL